MWFKQLSIYPLNKAQLPTLETLADKLSAAEFAPCMGLDWDSVGFAAPASFQPQEMVFAAQNTWRVALKKEEKVLPAAVVRDILDDKVQEIQNAEGRNVGRKEKQELKDNITDDLLPRTNQSPGSLMTDWLLRGAGEGGFELDSDCELKGLGDAAATVRMSKQDLSAEEVINHVKNGKIVTQLGLCWQERVRFVLTQDFTLKRIQFLDVLQEEAESHGDDMASLMFASQILMSEALSTLVAELVLHLGGWAEQ